MLQPVPNFSWYSSNSNRLGLPPRCPFASIHRCPKFYESRSLLGRAGSTPLSAEIETECERKWKQSQFTPQTAEDTPGLFSTEKGVNAFNNFCPEVLYDRFGLFADFLSNYSDEIDRDLAHSRLARDGAQTDDPGWTWSSVRAQHFSECPLYSSLSHGHQPNFQKEPAYNESLPRVMKFDVFISHASEDKKTFVRDLARELTRLGISVWYDEATLQLGDRLREKIDEGLANCRYGVVVLSHSFFSKNWPQAELEGLFAREMQGKKVILPLWHNISKEEVLNYSPMLAGKLAALTEEGVERVAEKIRDVVCHGKNSPTPLPLVAKRADERPRIELAIPSILNLEVKAVLDRLRRTFKAHGLEPAHLGRFLEIQKAPFGISMLDFQSDEAFLHWLTEEKIAWIAKTFLIRREWIDGEDDQINEMFRFDKQPKRFYETISEHTQSDWNHVPAGPEAYFFRLGTGKKWLKSDRQEILFVLAAPLARFSNERIVYKYVCDFSGYPWNYQRTNIQTRAWARLLSNNSRCSVFGGELSFDDAEFLQSNTKFLREIIHDGKGLHLHAWHPDDYAFDESESAAAVDTEAIPQVIDFLKRHDLPWESVIRLNRR